MTPTVDWAAATDALTAAARDQFARFLVGPRAKQVYAVGLFFDPDAGDVFPVANTVDHHLQSYRALVKEYGPHDELPQLWDSGNWQFPAGLPPDGTRGFGDVWPPTRSTIEAAAVDAPDDQHVVIEAEFRRICVEALRRLAADGVFAPATELLGFVVQSPADRADEIVAEQERVTAAVRGGMPDSGR